MTYLNSDKLLNQLEALKREDIDIFYNVVFNSLSSYPDEAVEDPSPRESKIQALDSMIEHFVEKEEFEKCSFIKEIIDRIG